VPSRHLALVAVTAVVAGLGAAAAAVALVGGGDGRASGTSGAVSTEPVSGPPVKVSGVDVTTGRAIGLGDFVEKPVVVTVWASWCAACPRQAEPLRHFSARHAEAGFLAVDTQEDDATARAFLLGHHLDLPTIADPDGRVAARLGVRELPTTIFLTSDHRVSGIWEGPAPVGRLRAGLQAAKAG
jgi:thiol-disulfide isomerase/thioredoxin